MFTRRFTWQLVVVQVCGEPPPRIEIIRFPLIILFERWGIIFKVTVSVNSSVHPVKLTMPVQV